MECLQAFMLRLGLAASTLELRRDAAVVPPPLCGIRPRGRPLAGVAAGAARIGSGAVVLKVGPGEGPPSTGLECRSWLLQAAGLASRTCHNLEAAEKPGFCAGQADFT
jgi:hypothetical protein